MIHLGTCSWKYPSWSGLVYSSREPGNYLEEYARKFDAVEVDQWFWSLGRRGAALPRPETVAEYDAATPPSFRFVVKGPDALTLPFPRGRPGIGAATAASGTGGDGVPASTGEANTYFLDADLFRRFLDSLEPLLPKIGLFIFQFEYLNRQKMPNRAVFMEKLDGFLSKLPEGLPYAVEIRNPRWIDDAWFAFLDARRAAPVFLQGYWMDDIVPALERWGAAAALNRGRLCVRLHGEDREGMEERTGEDWSRIVRPKDDELERLAAALRAIRAIDREPYVDVNNHYEGSAPLTIEKLRPLLWNKRST